MALFKDFSLPPVIQQALDALGFTQPTEIQEKAIPLLFVKEKIDFHGQAQTGTGKTLAFGIPLLAQIDESKKNVQAIIIAPTRELVLQITESLKQIAKFANVRIESIYGGSSMMAQINALKRGVHVVVGTPGRLNDHLRRGTLRLDGVNTFVLDEADLMLDMGFKEDIDEILKHVPKDRQIWLFSATVKPGIKALKKSHMREPVSVSVMPHVTTVERTEQFYALVPVRDRLAALCRFIDSTENLYGFVFCRTKILASEIADILVAHGYKACALHGDMSQEMRNKVMQQFKKRECTILVATDVAARGIDVSNATHVINFSLPEDPENYVHRIGRTGRAGQAGIAISFISKKELNQLMQLSKRLGAVINPIEIPTLDDVLTARLHKVDQIIETLCEKTPEQHPYFQKIQALFGAYSKEELMDGFASIIFERYFKELAQEKEISFPSQDRHAIHEDDVTELVILLGSDDEITKQDILRHILKPGIIPEKEIKSIRVILKRSFISVPSTYAHDLLNALKGKEIHGKRARIDIVEQDREDRRRDRRGSRFRGRSRS